MLSAGIKIPQIKEIIEKRKRAIIDNLLEKKQYEDKEKFDEICSILDVILDNVGEFLLAVNINDYRRTFLHLKDILYNERWLQKTESVKGAFTVGVFDDYILNRPNIFRALALGEEDVYSSEDSIIPNLLENREDGGDLWKLLALRYILHNHLNKGWKESINLAVSKEKIRKLFSDREDYADEFEYALGQLIRDRILLRGRLQEQHDSVDLDFDEVKLNDIKYVYPSNVAKLLWDNLAKNSILFELFIDDIWIENPYRSEDGAAKRFIQFNLLNYQECIIYLDYLIGVEEEIWRTMRQRRNLEIYCSYFGESCVTHQLLKGLRKSYDAYFKEYNNKMVVENALDQQLIRISSKISELQTKFLG